MTLKCPNCGKLLKGEPGFIGMCPYCKTKVEFPEGKQYQCPHCGNVQLGDVDICRNCGKSMLRRPMFSSVLGRIMLICSIVSIVLYLPILFSFFGDMWLYGASMLLLPALLLIMSIIFVLISVSILRYSKSHSERIEVDGLARQNDRGGFLWGLLGFLIPLVGLILYLVWIDDRPRTARSAGMGALTLVLIPITLLVMYLVYNVVFYFATWLIVMLHG